MKLAIERKLPSYGIGQQYEPPPILYNEFQHVENAKPTISIDSTFVHNDTPASIGCASVGEKHCKCVYCSRIHKPSYTPKRYRELGKKRVKLHQCKSCSQTFLNIIQLRKHSRSCKNCSKPKRRCFHIDCTMTFPKLSLVARHLKSSHITEMGLTFEFYSHEEFDTWSNKCLSEFVLIKAFRSGKLGVHYRYYLCKRFRTELVPDKVPCQGKIFVSERGNGTVVNYLPHSETCNRQQSTKPLCNGDMSKLKDNNLLQEDKLRNILSNHKFNDIDADKDIESLKKSIRTRIHELNECVLVGDVKSLLSIEYVLKELLKTYSKTEERTVQSTEEEVKLPLLVPDTSQEPFTDQLKDAGDVNKVVFNVGPYGISSLHLKSLDYNIPLAECTILKSVAPDFRKGWLYDTIIDAFLYRLCKPYPGAMFLETAVSQIINSNSLSSLRMQLGDKQLTNIEKIFVAINPNGKHWVLLVVKPRSKQIEVYDPTSKKKTVGLAVMKFVKLLICVLLNDFGSNEFWDIISPKHIVQKGNYNCGVYVCWYAERILLEKDVVSTFSGSDFRKYIYDFIGNSNGVYVNGH